MKRTLWKLAGTASLVIGVIGIVVPLLPTTPFLLLAAFCYQRGSERLHDWLVNHPRFGPAIRDWRTHGVISRTAKRNAMIAMVAVLGLSILLEIKPWIIAVQFVVLSVVAAFILSRPSVPRDQQ
ncbi:MAG: YbaN family protein [Hyphomicrobiaceae bacterium]